RPNRRRLGARGGYPSDPRWGRDHLRLRVPGRARGTVFVWNGEVHRVDRRYGAIAQARRTPGSGHHRAAPRVRLIVFILGFLSPPGGTWDPGTRLGGAAVWAANEPLVMQWGRLMSVLSKA